MQGKPKKTILHIPVSLRALVFCGSSSPDGSLSSGGKTMAMIKEKRDPTAAKALMVGPQLS